MSLITEEMRSKADIHHGNDICQERSKYLFQQMGLPISLLPLNELEECGYISETGFVWMKQKKKTVHKFEKIGKVVSYESVITGFIELNRMKKLTGVKSKEILIWVSVTDFCFDPFTKKITFKTPTGFYRSFPASAFEKEVMEKMTETEVGAEVDDDEALGAAKVAEKVKEV